MRKDARFSDGKPVTARAFKHALERILNPAMDAGASSDFTAIVGAQEMLDGKATTLDGAAAKGRTLTLRLTKPVPDFLLSIAGLCAVPPDLPVDPEGAKAPLPSAAPYYAAEYVPGERLVLERNRFYQRKPGPPRRPLRRLVERRPGLGGRRHREREVRLLRGTGNGHAPLGRPSSRSATA